MTKFAEQLQALKDSLKKTITSESTTEDISRVDELEKQLDQLGESHQQLVTEYSKMKDIYIEKVMNYGTSSEPRDDDAPKSLEEIANEVIAKRQPKK